MNRVIFLQHLPLDKKLTGCLVTENIITKSLADCTGIDMGYVGSVGSDENTISNNIISGSGSTSINVNASLGSLNNVISGNTIINSADYGIMLQTDSWGTQRDLSGTVVSGNEISGGSHGIGVTYGKGTAASPIVIRDNHVHGVTTGTKGDIEGIEVYNSAYVDVVRNVVEANATGIQVKGSLCEGVMVRYSDITGNTVGVEAVDLTAGAPLDAKYNWWGNASGPYNATTNPSGSGDAVSGAYVSYSPWLYKSQSECVTTSYPAASRSLSVGWNTLSVPAKLITTADAINELVPSGISAGYYFDGIWKELNPSSVLFPCDAIYIKMTSAKTVLFQIDGAATYVPTKELALGWNLIGLANVSSLPVNAAVASVSGSYAQVVSPSMNSHEWVWIAGQVDTPPPMLVGEGYWIFITKTPATLGGFTICPIVPKY